MTDDIIRMAREAGWKDLREFDSEMYEDFFMGKTQDLERFADLVRADEREACAQVAEDMLRFYTQAVTGVPQAIRARGKQ